MLGILVYSLSQGELTLRYLKGKKATKTAPDSPESWPIVTVQLPIFNEIYVVERLIRNAAKFDYPGQKLEIQVLDDSTDETTEIAQKVIDELAESGLDIKLIHRDNRQGFKAGALEEGMNVAKGEFLAVFDSDFLPKADFLRRTIPYFKDGVGAVQARWEHLNEDFSLLTKLQGLALDAHFSIEQQGRSTSGSFLNFNGTAGVWRKECITNSGGWSAETLTEDLDLSYRAQMKGWKIEYLEEYTAPAEIPAMMPAVKTQQYRWNKGGAENARKNLNQVLKSDKPMSVKAHAFFHLMSTGVFILVLISAVASVPLLEYLWTEPFESSILRYTYVFFLGFFLLAFFYWNSMRQRRSSGARTTLDFLRYFPAFLSLSMGLSWHNSLAVIEGYLGKKTPFVRTPKFALLEGKGHLSDNRYLKFNWSSISFVEGLFAIYFAYGVFLGISLDYPSFLPFHVLLCIGFGGIFFYSLKHSFLRS